MPKRVRGLDKFERRITRLRTQAVRDISQALFRAGQNIEVTAEFLITQGSVSGAGHVPSAPGQPPNRAIGVLDGNIETIQARPYTVLVSSNAPYAAALEFGTSRMAARPYMAPAVAMKREEAGDFVRQVVRRAQNGR